MDWYYAENEEKHGPVSEAEFKSLVDSGKITDDSYVWNETLEAWVVYGDIRGASTESAPAAAPASSANGEGGTARPEFQGSGKEFFGIWIVNSVLSILTLGIYLPWARVRTRRYFYRNTRLFNEPFDYLADPKKILIGFVIIASFYLLYIGINYVNPIISGVILFLFMLVMPLFVYKAYCFFARNSAYRNISLRFAGKVGESYTVYLFMLLLMPFTLGLIYPFIEYRRKKYFWDNMKFGNTKSEFSGTAGYFYKIYLLILAMFMGIGVFMGILIPTVTAVIQKAQEAAAQAGGAAPISQADGAPDVAMIIAIQLIMYVVFIFIGLIMNALIKVKIGNYCWNNLRLGKIMSFKSDMRVRRYMWIMFSNFFLTIITLGAYYPWAKVKLHRYRISCLAVNFNGDWDSIMTNAQDEVNAIGDTVTEFFDIDIGF